MTQKQQHLMYQSSSEEMCSTAGDDDSHTNLSTFNKKIDFIQTEQCYRALRLNVGGKVFVVGPKSASQSTLLTRIYNRFQCNNKFSIVNSQLEEDKEHFMDSMVFIDDATGDIFIDRDSNEFAELLEYLRTGELHFSSRKSSKVGRDHSSAAPKDCDELDDDHENRHRILRFRRCFAYYGVRGPYLCKNCNGFYDPLRNSIDACIHHSGTIIVSGELENNNHILDNSSCSLKRYVYSCCNLPEGSLGCTTSPHTLLVQRHYPNSIITSQQQHKIINGDPSDTTVDDITNSASKKKNNTNNSVQPTAMVWRVNPAELSRIPLIVETGFDTWHRPTRALEVLNTSLHPDTRILSKNPYNIEPNYNQRCFNSLNIQNKPLKEDKSFETPVTNNERVVLDDRTNRSNARTQTNGLTKQDTDENNEQHKDDKTIMDNDALSPSIKSERQQTIITTETKNIATADPLSSFVDEESAEGDFPWGVRERRSASHSGAFTRDFDMVCRPDQCPEGKNLELVDLVCDVDIESMDFRSETSSHLSSSDNNINTMKWEINRNATIDTNLYKKSVGKNAAISTNNKIMINETSEPKTLGPCWLYALQQQQNSPISDDNLPCDNEITMKRQKKCQFFQNKQCIRGGECQFLRKKLTDETENDDFQICNGAEKENTNDENEGVALVGVRKKWSPANPKYKTKICPQYRAGGCPRSSAECKFAHGLEELRGTREFFKTQICTFWMAGFCRAGVKCRHAHGDNELRYSSSSLKLAHDVEQGECKEPFLIPSDERKTVETEPLNFLHNESASAIRASTALPFKPVGLGEPVPQSMSTKTSGCSSASPRLHSISHPLTFVPWATPHPFTAWPSFTAWRPQLTRAVSATIQSSTNSLEENPLRPTTSNCQIVWFHTRPTNEKPCRKPTPINDKTKSNQLATSLNKKSTPFDTQDTYQQ